MARGPAPPLRTLFSARELIAAIPPPSTARLHAPALVRAALLSSHQPAAEPPRTRWWQISADLLRDGGMLVARDAPRGRRRVAFWGALIYQAVWFIALIWLAWARFAGVPGTTAAQQHGAVVEVEFIENTRAADAAASAPLPLDAAPPAPAAAPPPVAAAPTLPVPTAREPERPPAAAPPEAAPVAESPLQVTEVAEPDQDFTLYAPELPPLPAPPPPRTRSSLPLQVADIPLLETPAAPAPPAKPVSLLPLPPAQSTEVAVREVPLLNTPTPALPTLQPQPAAVPVPSVSAGEVALREIPLLQAPSPNLPTRAIALPGRAAELPTLEAELRPIPGPLPDVTMRPRAPPTLPPGIGRPGADRAERQVQARDIALQAAATPAQRGDDSAAASPATSTAPAAPTRESASTAAAPPATQAATTTPPGSVPGTQLADDWGQTASGTGSGLLDESGRPRLADGAGASRLPPGTLVEHYENIDRMGTWLKRPPTGYQSSLFEQFWLPPENLLEEWVRRSIKNIVIPIPGTGKSIQCTVAFLMLGGGCGIRDGNLLDIEATARTPPEVPFKPELHEDQSILAAPAAPVPHPLPLPVEPPGSGSREP